MDGNKDESERCIEIAVTFIRLGNTEKAIKMLRKAEALFPSPVAKNLLGSLLAHSESPCPSSDTNSARKRGTTAYEKNEERPYTIEQAEIVSKVKRCKDFYEVLGVSVESTDSEIKKAYKKLALQLHPDKNSAPGAAEAFKKVGTCVATLTDLEKRKTYDLYGPDEGRKGGLNNGYYESDECYEGGTFESYFTPEEIFNMYFSNNYHPHAHRPRRFHQHRHDAQRSGEAVGDHQQMTFALILMVVVVLSMTTFFRSDPPYSLQPTSEYSLARKTSNFRIPYYVKPTFDSDYQGSLPRLDLAVEEQYIANMKHLCIRERNYREMMMARARSFGHKAQFVHAQELKTPSCDNLYRIGKYNY